MSDPSDANGNPGPAPRPRSGAGSSGPDSPTEEPSGPPAWHSFGVPHGGAPEPPAYTPAMRERPRGDLTQPIDTSTTQAVPAAEEAGPPPTSETSGGWWSTPGALGGSPEHDRSPEPDQPRAGAASSATAATDASWHPTPRVDGATPAYAAPQGPPYAAPSWAPGVPPGPPGGPGGPWVQGAVAGPYGPGAGGTTPIPLQPGPPSASGPRSDGRRRWAGLATLAVVAALLGGGVALAGQQLLTRGSTLGSAVPAPGPGSTARPDGSIAKIAADALPSVVTIRIKTSQGNGTGSGFVIDQQGHILTNNHVVAAAAGSGGEIQAELNNGTTLPAKVVGADASYDLAVIKVEGNDLAPLQFGASKDVVVGDGVIAVGAPLGLDATVTSGIVSALNRPVTPGGGNDQSFINAIQTDAAINPGNSGGPLLDMNGRVIGINSAIARIPGSTTDPSGGGNIGVGFAIPSDQASKTAQQLIATGKADHPALGVNVDRSYTGDGAKIAAGGVKAGSAAEKAGLREGDVVTEFEGKKVTDADALIVAIRARSVGDTVSMKVQRGNQTVAVSVPLQSASG